MFATIFKSATYALIWRKFKKEIRLVFVSLVSIIVIFTLYNDIYQFVKDYDKEYLLWVIIIKWFLILSIIFINIMVLRKLNNKSLKEGSYSNLNESKNIYDLSSKEVLTTKTDLIINKYKQK